MNLRFACLGMIGALLPLAVEVPVDSAGGYQGTTRVRVGFGAGTYAFIARGCEGQVIDEVPVHFSDIGASLEHRVGSTPLTFGVRGGRLLDRIGTPKDSLHFPGVPLGRVLENTYVNPFVSIEGPDGGFGVGWIAHRREFITADERARTYPDHSLNDMSVHMRAGPLAGGHFTIQWMEGVPLASSGGYFTALLSGPMSEKPGWTMRGGMGAGGPYEGAGLVLGIGHTSDASLSFDLTTRIGFGDKVWGAALGIAYAAGP